MSYQFLQPKPTQSQQQSSEEDSSSQERKRFDAEAGYANTPPGHGTRGTGGENEDDFDRLIALLRRIHDVLTQLVRLGESKLPKDLYRPLVETLPQLDESIETAVATLADRDQRPALRPQLVNAGLTDEMLDMKEVSINFHMNNVENAILTYGQDESFFDKLLRKVKPGFKVMNSLLGSLRIPGSEIAKEFKEHVEAAYEHVETES